MPGIVDPSAPLSVAIVGSGLGRLSAAIALRRAGRRATLYERYDFGGEVGASLSVASNSSSFLREWDIDIPAAKPVVLKSLVRREWGTGDVEGVYPLGDYRERFGTDYNNFYRIDLHNHLKEVALSDSGRGSPVKLLPLHHLRRQGPRVSTRRVAERSGHKVLGRRGLHQDCHATMQR